MVAKKLKTGTVDSRAWYALAAARILLGVTFLWAFVDKLFGLGFATPVAKAWLNGGSPTTGFLQHVTGPFAGIFSGIAGMPWTDWLFMFGLLGIGVGLIFGVAVRLSTLLGGLLLFMMWMASQPLENNPLIDDHIIYIAALGAIAYALPEQRLGLGTWWQSLDIVKKNRWLA